MTRFNVSFDGIMDRLEELERENHRLIAERDARHQQVIWRNTRIDELQTMIDAMRPMVALVARGCVDEATIGFPEFIVALDGDDSASEIANAESLIEQARAFVAAHPTAGVTFADTDGSDPDAYDEAESEA